MTDRPIIRADFVKPMPVPSRKVLQLVFEVSEEEADHAMEVLGGYPQSGQNRWCAIAQLADTGAAEAADEQTDDGRKSKEIQCLNCGVNNVDEDGNCPICDGDERQRPKGGPICKRAVLLCKRADFQHWQSARAWQLWQKQVPMGEAEAAECLRGNLNIASRSDLDHEPKAARIFEAIERDFYAGQHGQTTEDYQAMAEDGR